MIIAIAGFAGSGKTTLGTVLAERLGYRLLSPSFKDLAKKEGVSLMEFQKRAEKDKNIDLKFDEYLKEEVQRGNCVVTTWLGPWMVEADFRVWLFAPLDVRAARTSERDKVPLQKMKAQIQLREKQNRERYLALYNIDIFDTSIFDVALNSARFSPEDMADAIISIMKTKKGEYSWQR